MVCVKKPELKSHRGRKQEANWRQIKSSAFESFTHRCCCPTVPLTQPTIRSEENPTAPKQSLSLIRERNVSQNVIGYSRCQIARQLPIRTFIDNMWISTRTRRLLPMDTPLLGLARLQIYECTKWPTARGGLLAVATCG